MAHRLSAVANGKGERVELTGFAANTKVGKLCEAVCEGNRGAVVLKRHTALEQQTRVTPAERYHHRVGRQGCQVGLGVAGTESRLNLAGLTGNGLRGHWHVKRDRGNRTRVELEGLTAGLSKSANLAGRQLFKLGERFSRGRPEAQSVGLAGLAGDADSVEGHHAVLCHGDGLAGQGAVCPLGDEHLNNGGRVVLGEVVVKVGESHTRLHGEHRTARGGNLVCRCDHVAVGRNNGGGAVVERDRI